MSSPPQSPTTNINPENTYDTYEGEDYEEDMEEREEQEEAINHEMTVEQRKKTQRKLQMIVKTLQRVRWSLKTFLQVWVTEEKDNQGTPITIHHHYWRTPRLRQLALKDAVNDTSDIPYLQDLYYGPPILSTLTGEFDRLISTPSFGQFDHTMDLDRLDFNQAFQSMQDIAPTWHALLIRLLSNQRSHWDSYSATPDIDTLAKRLFMITSLVSHSRAKKQSNFLCSILDMYLLGSGVKRRVIETLSGLGICHSYHQANRLIRDIANNAKNHIRSLAADPQTIIVYDNINFKENKRDERLGHKATMQAMTTAAIIMCPELPPTGLYQSMHNPSIELNVFDIFQSPGISGDNTGVKITQSLISDAVRRVHGSCIDSLFKDTQNSTLQPRMPIIQQIQANKTKFWQFGAIPENEGTIQGTYAVQDNIFLDQLGLKSPNNPLSQDIDDFRDRLYLVHGDQLTAHHIRSVKKEQVRAERPYDKRNWLLGIPAWFHIQMNLLNTIVRTHWAPITASQEAHHCIEADIITWGRSHSSRDNVKYHLLAPIIAQSFTARVLALFYAAMRRRGYLIEAEAEADSYQISFERPDYVNSMIRHLTPFQYLELVEDVRLCAFTLDAWNGKGHEDIEFKTMCRMLQEIELFLTVRHAIKHADIGLLRRLVDPLIIYFFGASQYNYGHEMLFYRWNLSHVNAPELQHSILASGLVNWHGRDTTHKPIDLGLEHLNGSCKIEMKCYKNSTHDIDIIFDRVCLTNTWIRELRTSIEDTFGQYMPSNHSTESTILDIFSLARTLISGDLAEPRNTEQLAGLGFIFESEDILRIGMDRVSEKVDLFNQQHVYNQEGAIVQESQSNESELITDINEYTNHVDERLDGIIDPIIDLTFDNEEYVPGFY